jgi:predicted hotdog family 3-hydroxylacyl-ACP dehydratase
MTSPPRNSAGIDAEQLRALLPHAGAMCLLESVTGWSADSITCGTCSHLWPHNPLRRGDSLAMVCGAEYGLQAAALHGALVEGGVRQPAGYLSGLSLDTLAAERLDDPSLGHLRVGARLELADRRGLIYAFTLWAESGARLLAGRGTILFPEAAASAEKDHHA